MGRDISSNLICGTISSGSGVRISGGPPYGLLVQSVEQRTVADSVNMASTESLMAWEQEFKPSISPHNPCVTGSSPVEAAI